jgi:hypothetical protein
VILLQKMKRHFEARAIEWGMAGWAVTWGLQILLNPEVFTHPDTASLNLHMLHTLEWLMPPSVAATFLGTLAVCIGLARAIALWVNGAWCQTPLVRVITSALSAFVVSNIVFSLMQGPPTLGLVTYSWLFAADCFSGFRAAKDYKILRDQLQYIRG